MSQEDSSKSGVPLVKPPLGMPNEGVMRQGRGFSYGEIDKAGATVDDVKTAHLRIDPLRKSAHDVNVKVLQELLDTRDKKRTTQKPKQKEKAKATVTKMGKAKGTSGKK